MGCERKDCLLHWTLFLSLFSIIKSVSANDTSGACVWWLIFTFAATAGGSAYLFYLVYILKQPLGKGHGLKSAEPEALKRETKDKKKEERKDKQAHEEIKNDIEKNKAPVGRDPRQANFTTPPKNKPINAEEIKVNVDEVSSQSNDPRAEARKNYPPKGFYGEAESNDSPPHLQAQYITKPPPNQNRPVGAISRPSEGVGVGHHNIVEEDDEGEYESEEEEEELDNQRNNQLHGHYQQARISQQQPGSSMQPGPSQILRNRPN